MTTLTRDGANAGDYLFDQVTQGTADDDVLQGSPGSDWIDGMGGSDDIDGGDGDDLLVAGDDDAPGSYNNLYGGSGNDTLIGGAGNDWMEGGDGDDRYEVTEGFGKDAIYDPSGSNVILLHGVSANDVYTSRDEHGLQLRTGNSEESLDIIGWFDGANGYTVQFDDGTVWNAEQLLDALKPLRVTDSSDLLFGGSEGDVIDGQGGNDQIYGGGGSNILRGGAGYDWIRSESGSDVVEGGSDSDFIEVSGAGGFFAGGTENDDVWMNPGGSLENAVLAFNAGDGNDTVWNVDGLADVGTLSLGGGINRDAISFSVDEESQGLVIRTGGSDSITLRGWFAVDSMGQTMLHTMRLQIVGAAGVELYDLSAAVTDYVTALGESPGLAEWAAGAALQNHVVDTYADEAIGGIVAYQYAMVGATNGLDDGAVEALMSSPGFGTSPRHAIPAASELIARISGTRDAILVSRDGNDLRISGGGQADTVLVGEVAAGGVRIGKMKFADGGYSTLALNDAQLLVETFYDAIGVKRHEWMYASDGAIPAETIWASNGDRTVVVREGGTIDTRSWSGAGELLDHTVSTTDESGLTTIDYFQDDGSYLKTQVFIDGGTLTEEYDVLTGERKGEARGPEEGYVHRWDVVNLSDGSVNEKHRYDYGNGDYWITEDVTRADGASSQSSSSRTTFDSDILLSNSFTDFDGRYTHHEDWMLSDGRNITSDLVRTPRTDGQNGYESIETTAFDDGQTSTIEESYVLYDDGTSHSHTIVTDVDGSQQVTDWYVDAELNQKFVYTFADGSRRTEYMGWFGGDSPFVCTFGRGDGAVWVSPDEHTLVAFAAGVEADQLWFSRDWRGDLIVSILGTNDFVHVMGWQYAERPTLVLADGSTLSPADADALADAMAGFPAPNIAQTQYTPAEAAALLPLIDAKWKGNLLQAGNADATLIGGSGRDNFVAGAGIDVFVSNGGHDVIDEGAKALSTEAHDKLILADGISREDVVIHRSGHDLVVDYGTRGATRIVGEITEGGAAAVQRLEFADGSFSTLQVDNAGLLAETYFAAGGATVLHEWRYNVDGSLASDATWTADGSKTVTEYDGTAGKNIHVWSTSGTLLDHRAVTVDGAGTVTETDYFLDDGSYETTVRGMDGSVTSTGFDVTTGAEHGAERSGDGSRIFSWTKFTLSDGTVELASVLDESDEWTASHYEETSLTHLDGIKTSHLEEQSTLSDGTNVRNVVDASFSSSSMLASSGSWLHSAPDGSFIDSLSSTFTFEGDRGVSYDDNDHTSTEERHSADGTWYSISEVYRGLSDTSHTVHVERDGSDGRLVWDDFVDPVVAYRSWTGEDGSHGLDFFRGGNGPDGGVQFSREVGIETVYGGNTAKIEIGAGIAAEQLWFEQTGSDLQIDLLGSGDVMKIYGWFDDPSNQPQNITLDDGRIATPADVQSLVEAMASFGAPLPGQSEFTPAEQQAMAPVIAASWHPQAAG